MAKAKPSPDRSLPGMAMAIYPNPARSRLVVRRACFAKSNINRMLPFESGAMMNRRVRLKAPTGIKAGVTATRADLYVRPTLFASNSGPAAT
jgi:hypothetical protein